MQVILWLVNGAGNGVLVYGTSAGVADGAIILTGVGAAADFTWTDIV